jgi:hypothetical protein
LNDGSFIAAGNTSSSDIEGYHQPVPGMYTVEGTDYWVIKLSAPVTSIPAPVVSIDPASAIVCSKGISTIKASVLYAGLHPIYQWTKNGVSVGTNSPVYSDSGFKNNDQVMCTVTGSGTLCDNTVGQGSAAVSVKVSNNTISPSITISTDNTLICDCLTITFKAVVSNAGSSPLYQWLINGKTVGSNSDVFLSSKLQSGDVVSCMYSDNRSCITNGSIVSNSITISAYDGSPPLIAVTASADTVCKGSVVTFTANALNAGANPAYQWKVNGINAGTNSNIFSSTTFNN